MNARIRVCLLAAVYVSQVFHSAKAVGQVPASQSTSSAAQPVAQEQFVAYWTTETGWHSELQLRNNLSGQSLTVAPALRLADGTETALAPVTVNPQEVKAIDLDAAIRGTSAQLIGTFGSIVLRYRSYGSGNLYAAAMIYNIGHSVAFHIDATAQLQNYETASREGIWWLPNSTANDYLVLSNQGNSPMQLALSLYEASGKEYKQPVLLGPRETSRLSVRNLVQAGGLTGSYGGIKVYALAHAGSLNTLHFVFDQATGFSALLKMFNHDPNAAIQQRDFAQTSTWTLRAPMLALSHPDIALGLPLDVTLQPQLLIRNTTGRPVKAALRFSWRGDAAAGKAEGPVLQLFPYETRRIDVAALQDGNTLPKAARWTSVTLTTDSKPDEVMAIATSHDTTLHYGAQTPFSDQLSFAWEGGMWEYDAQHDSILTAGNGGTKPTKAGFTIFYNQGAERYDLEQTLQPEDLMWIDIGKLIREQTPDKNGKTLPTGLTSGSYEFRDLTDTLVGSLFEGKVIYDKTYGHVTYGCASCCEVDDLSIAFDPLILGLQSSSPNTVTGINCNGTPVDVGSKFYYDWSTISPSVATVDIHGTHTGVGAGSTGVSAFGYLPIDFGSSCPLQKQTVTGTDNVQVPTSLKFVSVTVLPNGTTGAFGCPSNYSGMRVDIKYQVMDQNTPPLPIQSSNMIPHEKGKLFSGASYDNNIGPVTNYPTSGQTTASDGTFHDVPLGACLGGGTFASMTATQDISILIGTLSFPVRSQSWTLTGTALSHGTIKNSISSPGTGSDVSASR